PLALARVRPRASESHPLDPGLAPPRRAISIIRIGGFDSKARTGVWHSIMKRNPRLDRRWMPVIFTTQSRGAIPMSKEENKAVVVRGFTDFGGRKVNLAVVDEIASSEMLLKYSLHDPRRGRDDIKAFMTDFRAAFPDLNFWATADLIAEGDYVVGQWE